MQELATVTKTLLLDRGQKKVRLNFIVKNNIAGCIVPYR